MASFIHKPFSWLELYIYQNLSQPSIFFTSEQHLTLSCPSSYHTTPTTILHKTKQNHVGTKTDIKDTTKPQVHKLIEITASNSTVGKCILLLYGIWIIHLSNRLKTIHFLHFRTTSDPILSIFISYKTNHPTAKDKTNPRRNHQHQNSSIQMSSSVTSQEDIEIIAIEESTTASSSTESKCSLLLYHTLILKYTEFYIEF